MALASKSIVFEPRVAVGGGNPLVTTSVDGVVLTASTTGTVWSSGTEPVSTRYRVMPFGPPKVAIADADPA